jgi:hypothetical protein
MANEAFALSPISARASLPSEEDYEAIREAFMETARGRWFLGEYARRNRNADTSMVLDAVARIEEALAAQKREPPPPPPVEDMRAEMLEAISSAVAKAEDAASSALDGTAVENSLAPIRKGARIIKEISWRWREIGADGRICDLIDSQVSAIEAGCSEIAGHDPRVALRAAFEIIRASIEAFSDAAAPAAAKVDDDVAEAPASTSDVPLAAVEQTVATVGSEQAAAAPAVPEEDVDAAVAKAEPPELAAGADAYDEADEAVLELIAAEMAAPDPDDEVADKPRAHVTEPPLIEPFVVVSEPEPVLPPAPSLQAAPVVTPAPSAEPSLGATILATGILPRPKLPASDPLAPIRRMSQAEKIAFFS